MRRVAGDERGFSLMELLVVMAISMVVLGGVLSIFETFLKQTRRMELRAAAQDTARTVTDDLVRTMRNQVGQKGAANVQLDRAGPLDLIFVAFDPAAPAGNTTGLRRVRYCLDATVPAAGRLVRQVQTWSSAAMPAAPSDTACPGTGWTTTTQMATGVTNLRNGLNRPLWAYRSATDGAVTTNVGIDASLWIAVDPAKATSEVNLATAVTLRNANRPPIAAFTVTRGTANSLILNAAPSQDPEGQPLRYAWTVGGTTVSTAARFETTTISSGTTVTLTVTDTGDLTAQQSQVVA
jgi:prepilin-type N-terminal cleavage/methylation domain-containing protein